MAICGICGDGFITGHNNTDGFCNTCMENIANAKDCIHRYGNAGFLNKRNMVDNNTEYHILNEFFFINTDCTITLHPAFFYLNTAVQAAVNAQVRKALERHNLTTTTEAKAKADEVRCNLISVKGHNDIKKANHTPKPRVKKEVKVFTPDFFMALMAKEQ